MNAARLSAMIRQVGVKNTNASISCPYTYAEFDGFRGRGNSDQECFLAAILIVFEGGPTPTTTSEEVAAAKDALGVAQQAAAAAGLAGDGEDEGGVGGNNIVVLQREYQTLKCRNTIRLNIESGAAMEALLDLVACEQIRPLSEKNIENFFKMKSLPDAPARAGSFVRFWASQAPRITQEESFMLRAEVSEFVRYHTGASTTADLMSIAIETPPFPGYFTAVEIAAVERAKQNRHELTIARRIPQFAIVKARIWLVLLERHPDIWHMGKKAEEKFPAMHYKLMQEHLKEMFKCTKRIHAPADGATADLPTLVDGFAALVASFRTTDGGGEVDAEEAGEGDGGVGGDGGEGGDGNGGGNGGDGDGDNGGEGGNGGGGDGGGEGGGAAPAAADEEEEDEEEGGDEDINFAVN
jgi:hypothetical protein